MMEPAPLRATYPPLPTQPPSIPWPVDSWPRGTAPDGVELDAHLDVLFDDDGPCATTNAALVIYKGQLIAERYAGVREFFDRPPEPVERTTPLISWSMAKSMLQGVVAMLVDEGALYLDAPAPVPEWADLDDPRHGITISQMLAMRDGLAFVEDYVDGGVSDVIEMLFGTGQSDMAHFAADRPLAHRPGTFFNYSSGTTNIISAIVRRTLGGEDAYREFLSNRLFGPLSMTTAAPTFDPEGTFVASSYVHAIAEDFARFGLAYLRGGVFNDRQVIPAWAVDAARTPLSFDEEGNTYYSSHWWVTGDEFGTFYCSGYEGQSIMCCPALDLLTVRLGRTPHERNEHLVAWRRNLVNAFGALR